MDLILIVSLVRAGVKLSLPLLMTSVGEIFAERSGVVNIGLGDGKSVLEITFILLSVNFRACIECQSNSLFGSQVSNFGSNSNRLEAL